MKEYIEKEELQRRLIELAEHGATSGPMSDAYHQTVLEIGKIPAITTNQPNRLIETAILWIRYRFGERIHKKALLEMMGVLRSQPSAIDLARAEIDALQYKSDFPRCVRTIEDCLEILDKYRKPVGEPNTGDTDIVVPLTVKKTIKAKAKILSQEPEPETLYRLTEKGAEHFNELIDEIGEMYAKELCDLLGIPFELWEHYLSAGYFEQVGPEKRLVVEQNHDGALYVYHKHDDTPINDPGHRLYCEVFFNALHSGDFSQLLQIEGLREWDRDRREEAFGEGSKLEQGGVHYWTDFDEYERHIETLAGQSRKP